MNASYVTYDSTGKLIGSYLQAVQPAHEAAHIIVADAERLAWVNYRANAARDGIELVPVVAPPPTLAQYTAAIQSTLDAKAQERRYDSILSACTYATSSVPAFAAEGQACVEWRDAVWSLSYDLMAQVQAGTLAQPTIAELLAMLPAMAWPA
jgi:hypothetical protein